MKMNIGRFLVGAFSVFLLGSYALADPIIYLIPPGNGYTNTFTTALNVQYYNIGGNVGQLRAFATAGTGGTLEQNDPAANGGAGVSITAVTFSLTANFNLTTGALLTMDPTNKITVAGTIASVPTDMTAFLHVGANTFYQASGVGSLDRYGDMPAGNTITRFDFTFASNSGQIWPGQPVKVILNPGTLTPVSGLTPSGTVLLDGYTSGISTTATLASPQLLWSNNASLNGTADVFAPLPRSAWAGLALLGLCGATRLRRRTARI